jgi:hypothetical protein
MLLVSAPGPRYDHQFAIEHVGPLRHGQGGKAAKTRFRAVCLCGYATKWRKFSEAMREDQEAHLLIAEDTGETVTRKLRRRAR